MPIQPAHSADPSPSDATDASAATIIDEFVHQCAWCGLVEDGPLAGTIPTSGGVPQMLADASHGICGTCLAHWRADFAGRKAH